MNHENFGKNAILRYLAVQIKIRKIYWKIPKKETHLPVYFVDFYVYSKVP